jgi:hypothetical protein
MLPLTPSSPSGPRPPVDDASAVLERLAETSLRHAIDAHAAGVAVDRVIVAPPLSNLVDRRLPGARPRRIDDHFVRRRKAVFRGVGHVRSGGAAEH